MRQPPTPPSVRAYQRDRLGVAEQAARECGDVWTLRPGVYVAAAADACHQVLARTTYEYGLLAGSFPTARRPDGSKPTSAEFASGHAARMRGLRPKAVAANIHLLAPGIAAFAADWPSDTPVDVLGRARRALTAIGGRYLFGPDAPELVAAGAGLGPARERLIAQSASWPRWWPSAGRRAVRRETRRFTRQLGQVIARRRADGVLGDDLLGLMLRPSPRHGALPDAAIFDSLTGLVVAVSETPTRATGWLLLALAQHPDVADKVAAEAATLPADAELITGEHLRRLRYTEAVVREVLRLRPPNWMLIRRAVTPTELAGYPIPAGASVLVCPYTAQRDPRQHAAPDRLRPERWLAGAESDPGVFLPFGVGPRSCEGTAMAMAELTLIAAEVARRYRLREPPGPEPSHQVTTDGALTPTGLRLLATPRHP